MLFGAAARQWHACSVRGILLHSITPSRHSSPAGPSSHPAECEIVHTSGEWQGTQGGCQARTCSARASTHVPSSSNGGSLHCAHSQPMMRNASTLFTQAGSFTSKRLPTCLRQEEAGHRHAPPSGQCLCACMGVPVLGLCELCSSGHRHIIISHCALC